VFRLHHPSVAQLRHPDLRKVHGPVLVLGKATGGRAPSISIDSGQSALERSLQMVSSVCGGKSDPTGASRPVVMGQDGTR
jgi:hypothetical protein